MSLELLFCDGYDIVDFQSTTLKYYTSITLPFYQGRIITGFGSAGAISIDNTAGTTVLESIFLGQQPVMFWNGNIRIQSSSFSKQVFAVLGTATSDLLQIQINNDGSLSLLDHTNTAFATSSQQLQLDEVYWLEVNVIFGASASYEVWLCTFGGTPAKILSGTTNLTTALPDRYILTWNSPGSYSLQLDNVTIWTAAALSDRNGPSKVVGLIAQTLAQSGGGSFAGSKGTSIIQSIADDFGAYVTTPDGILSYAQTGFGNLMVLVATPSCTGLVLGVALNACVAPQSGATSMNLVANERAGPYLIGSPAVQTGLNLVPDDSNLSGFATYQAVAQFNQEAMDWNDLQIATTQWGVEPASANITQLYLEKVVDLTGKKFGCGEASYSY